MSDYNNVKLIREIYGATQDSVARIAGVSRSTVSLWENGSAKASNSKLEKMSIYFGIGPEFFYDKELSEEAKQALIENSKREEEITKASDNKRNKVEELSSILEAVTFEEARSRFMFSMKMLLATADEGELDDLKTSVFICEKMLRRLKAVVEIREEEESYKKESNEETLFDLLNQ